MKFLMSILTILTIFSAFNAGAMTNDRKACIKTLASAPYCMNILSANANCAKGPMAGPNIKSCMDGILTRAKTVGPNLRHVMNVMCLADEISDSRSPYNHSLCK